MSFQLDSVVLGGLLAAGLVVTGDKLWARLELSRAKAPGLVGHVRWARRLSKWLVGHEYSLKQALQADGATPALAQQRNAALESLSLALNREHHDSVEWTRRMMPRLSDLQLINRYRGPYQFAAMIERLPISSVWLRGDGNRLYDLDGKAYWDLTGSYGLNVLGTDFYKKCIVASVAMAGELGPVLGSYHPVVEDNARRLCEISGMDEVTFHMSGTEAVMQAVRLARYQTGRTKVVRFAGAYHGWWDDVQPGPGNPMPPSEDTLTLAEMSATTLRVLRRRKDIACVLVNPIQALHPNRSAPGDSTLVADGRQVRMDRQAYAQWLTELREVCRQKNIAFILDEVFLGFRLAYRGAQEFYGIDADLVTYGKTLGGGLPVGVICGKAAWMRRYRPGHPADLCFARGTFNAHPYVMASMNAFLRHWMGDECRKVLEHADAHWGQRLERFNQSLSQAGVPVRMEGIQSVWTLVYTLPSRYNWMLQFYLRKHGLALSWVGTGRLIFNFSYSDAEFDQVIEAFLAACAEMQNGGWWTVPEGVTRARIQRQLARETLGQLLRR
jgi:glutamate-1-semialdehyde 2,1-aminomutase